MLLIPALLCAGISTATASPPELAAMDGSHWVTPGKFVSHPATILFWSPDCPPCRIELAHLAELQAADPGGVLILAAIGRKTDARRVLGGYTLPAAIQNALAPRHPRGLLARLGNPKGALPFSVRFTGKGRACAYLSGPLTPAAMKAMRRACESTPRPQ